MGLLWFQDWIKTANWWWLPNGIGFLYARRISGDCFSLHCLLFFFTCCWRAPIFGYCILWLIAETGFGFGCEFVALVLFLVTYGERCELWGGVFVCLADVMRYEMFSVYILAFVVFQLKVDLLQDGWNSQSQRYKYARTFESTTYFRYLTKIYWYFLYMYYSIMFFPSYLEMLLFCFATFNIAEKKA